MKIALFINAQNFASSLLPELARRGHDAKLYATYRVHLDRIGYRLNSESQSLASRAIHKIGWNLEKRKKHDLILNYADNSHPFQGPEIMYWQGVETWPEWRDKVRIERPGYYCTPDIAENLPEGSILLPRAVNTDLFKQYRRKKTWDGERPLRIGHFWKRGSIESSYTMRYWKRSDLLDEAVSILNRKGVRTELVNGPILRAKMPETLASLDVLAEEFGYLSHGATAVEALMTGTPVVGCYNPSLCESPETLDMLINCLPNPDLIADEILKAADNKLGSTLPVEEYYSPSHAADVLEDTWEKLV